MTHGDTDSLLIDVRTWHSKYQSQLSQGLFHSIGNCALMEPACYEAITLTSIRSITTLRFLLLDTDNGDSASHYFSSISKNYLLPQEMKKPKMRMKFIPI